MLASTVLLLAATAYMVLLFAIASFGDRRATAGRSMINSSVVYALSLAVYCTSWTFYGSVGRAATRGLDFLPIYLGPTLVFCLGWVLLSRILRVSKTHRITSIADLIASRFGKSGTVAGLVTVIAVIGSVPYIALQLKAVSTSLKVLLEHEGGFGQGTEAANFLRNTEIWVAGVLALFAILFGTRKIDASERHEGIVAAIAFESIIKLISFVAVGVFAGLVLFDGFGDIFARAAERPELMRLFEFRGAAAGIDWLALTFLAAAAIICLPRQFQVMVVENVDERHLDRALWLFPAYLIAINLFVVPIALAGILKAPPGTDPDTLVLTLPLTAGSSALAILAFLGGLSAAASMVIVETVALSTMICNDLAVPLLLRLGRLRADTRPVLLGIRRAAIAVVVLLGFAYMRVVRESYGLVSIGLVSFAAVAQFFPAIVLGLFWRRASRFGALAGITAGFVVWAYTLLLPSFASAGWLPRELFELGPLGFSVLRPSALFGLEGLDPVTHGLFWSMLLNIAGIIGVSLFVDQSALERSQAALFVDYWRGATRAEGRLWRGTAQMADLVQLVGRFLGEAYTREAFAADARRHGRDPAAPAADAETVRLAERLLAGAIGSASARVMVASVVHEEPIGTEEVMRILDETSQVIEYSRRLEQQSRALEATTAELRCANERLLELDRLKDDFVSTVSHELRTPLTSIRSFSEILLDNPGLEQRQRQEFLRIIVTESERLTRLINDMLDLAKIEAGKLDWHMQQVSVAEIAREAAAALSQLFRDKDVKLELQLADGISRTTADRDRLFQVVVNLLSNAVKFSPHSGLVTLAVKDGADCVTLSVADNGPGIAPSDRESIFERFRQVGNTLTAKPEGSGLGLAISRMIVEHFGGRVWVEDAPAGGAVFRVRLPRGVTAATDASHSGQAGEIIGDQPLAPAVDFPADLNKPLALRSTK
jgi:Na+/proline symporter/nitrogen-specific signal transduction histidine kinase